METEVVEMKIETGFKHEGTAMMEEAYALRYSVYRWVRYHLAREIGSEDWEVTSFVTERNDWPMVPHWWHPTRPPISGPTKWLRARQRRRREGA
jgi:hypothetical protein